MKKALNILIWIAVLAGIGAALAFMKARHQETLCQGFELRIINDNPDLLISEEALRNEVIRVSDSLDGKPLADIRLEKVYQSLKNNPYVRAIDVQTNISGFINIKVALRKVIIRVINNDGYSYYIDEEGYLLPVNEGYPSRVILASGKIRDGITSLDSNVHYTNLNRDILAGLYAMARHIDHSVFLKKMISQLYVNGKGEFVMIPLVGDYELRFGSTADMATKFEKLEIFYREGAGKTGWVDYKTVDLRYENQVICSKK